jgi:isopenicillin N synthase-like dioxygenase
MRPILERWIEKMKILGMAVMRAFADGLEMSDEEWQELRGLIDNSFWVMRVIGKSLHNPLSDKGTHHYHPPQRESHVENIKTMDV